MFRGRSCVSASCAMCTVPEVSGIPHTQWTLLQLKNNLVHCLSHSCEMHTYGFFQSLGEKEGSSTGSYFALPKVHVAIELTHNHWLGCFRRLPALFHKSPFGQHWLEVNFGVNQFIIGQRTLLCLYVEGGWKMGRGSWPRLSASTVGKRAAK